MEVILLDPESEFGGPIERGRHRIGVALVTLGATITSALLELALRVAPGLSGTLTREEAKRRWWPGLLVLAVLALGLLAAGDLALVLIREALPHRSGRP